MDIKDNLTNEVISRRFDNQFDLVNYAIGIAEDMIHAGRGPRVRTETENTALQVLEEIYEGKDQFEAGEETAEEEVRTEEMVQQAGSAAEAYEKTEQEGSEQETILSE